MTVCAIPRAEGSREWPPRPWRTLTCLGGCACRDASSRRWTAATAAAPLSTTRGPQPRLRARSGSRAPCRRSPSDRESAPLVDRRLDWRFACRGDKETLKRFTCTVPKYPYPRLPGQPVHPRIWEFEVESYIHDLRPEVPGERVLLGWGGENLAAVAAWQQLAGPGSGQVFLRAAAVGLAHRRTSHGPIGRELFDVLLEQIGGEARDAGADRLVILGNVHRRNQACQELCLQVGFTNQGDIGDGYDEWTYATWL